MRTHWKLSLAALIFLAASEAEPPAVSYYFIESAMQTASGARLPSSIALVKRTLDRERNRIEESVISLRGSAPAQEFLTSIMVEGSKAKISCTNCDMEGEGELVGEPWAWSGFRFKTKVGKSGQQVEGEDRFTATGMSVEKRVAGADGRPGVTIKETGTLISQASYDILRAKLLPK